MKKHKSKWFYGLDLNELDRKDPIVFVITEDMIQNMAEANLKRELTDIEMNRAHFSFIEDDEVIDSRDVAILNAIFSAVDNKDNQWVGLDEDFKKDKNGK